jgi:hypothetical protein
LAVVETAEARRAYYRLVSLAADRGDLSASDARTFDEVRATLGLSLDEAEADINALAEIRRIERNPEITAQTARAERAWKALHEYDEETKRGSNTQELIRRWRESRDPGRAPLQAEYDAVKAACSEIDRLGHLRTTHARLLAQVEQAK